MSATEQLRILCNEASQDLRLRLDDNVHVEKIGESSLHISLSKEFGLRYHQIQVFKERLEASWPKILRFKIAVLPQYQLLWNEEKTKLFQCLLLHEDDTQQIMQLIKHIDNILSEFSQPRYYEVI
jgi:hypothetical protein